MKIRLKDLFEESTEVMLSNEENENNNFVTFLVKHDAIPDGILEFDIQVDELVEAAGAFKNIKKEQNG